MAIKQLKTTPTTPDRDPLAFINGAGAPKEPEPAPAPEPSSSASSSAKSTRFFVYMDDETWRGSTRNVGAAARSAVQRSCGNSPPSTFRSDGDGEASD